jgi:hypothetical protein
MYRTLIPVPLLTEFPLLQRYRLLSRAVAEIAHDQGIYEGLWARAEWYLKNQPDRFNGEQLEAICEVADFFVMSQNPVLTARDRELMDIDWDFETEYNCMVMGEGGLTDRLVEAVPEYLVLNKFLNEVFDGDCPVESLYSLNSYRPDENFEPKFKQDDQVVVRELVREIDEASHLAIPGVVLLAQVCPEHDAFHGGPQTRVYTVATPAGVLEFFEDALRFADTSKEM